MLESNTQSRQMFLQELLVLFYVAIVFIIDDIHFYRFTFIAICAALSVIYVAVDLFNDRTCLKTYKEDLLLLFTGLSLVSIIVNFKYAAKDSVLFSFTLFLDYMIFYNYGSRDKKQAKKYFKNVTHFYMLISTVLVLFSLLMFLFQISRVFYVKQHRVYQGLIQARLYGIFHDPNYGAMSCLVVLFLSLYFMIKEKKTYRKVLYFYMALFHFFYMILSGSRTAVLALIASAFVAGFFISYKFLLKRPWSKMKRTAACIAVAAAVCAVCMGGYYGSRTCLAYTPLGIKYVQGDLKYTNMEEEPLPISLERGDVGEDKDVSNNRFRIWASAFRLITQKPLFGTSPRNHVAYAKSNFPAEYISITGYWTHNSILEVALFSGVPAFFAIVLFVCFCAHRAFLHLFTKPDEDFDEVLLCTVIITALLTAGMTLSGLFYNRGAYNTVFWLTMGYLMVYVAPKENDNLCLRIFNRIFPQKSKALKRQEKE